MEEFHQGDMSVLEYSSKFTKLTKYASCLASNPRDEMNSFVMSVSDDLVKECRPEMLHDNMEISHSMVHEKS